MIVVVLLFSLAISEYSCSLYTNTWMVEVKDPSSENLKEIFKFHDFELIGSIGSFPNYLHIRNRKIHSVTSNEAIHLSSALLNEKEIISVKQQKFQERYKRDFIPNDPFFKFMWYILNTGQSSGPAGVDTGVMNVWNQNITGKGVVISVLDDGVDYTHPDIFPNYARFES